MTVFNNQINEKIKKYYKKYYKDELGFKDWKQRIELRLDEENIFCKRYIDRLKEWLNYDFLDKKVLVVGSGTGGEIVNFFREGANVYAIEPNLEASEISILKAENIGLDKKCVKNCYSEDINFSDNTFDFVYCFTVLEHVNDVEKSISEMIRVAKKGGYIFIHTPDYRQMYEAHYKLPLPMFLPIFINRILLKLLGRPSNFLKSIKKVNSLYLRNIFDKLPVHSFRVYLEKEDVKVKALSSKIILKICHLIFLYLDASFNQIWILKKHL